MYNCNAYNAQSYKNHYILNFVVVPYTEVHTNGVCYQALIFLTGVGGPARKGKEPIDESGDAVWSYACCSSAYLVLK